VRDDRHMNLKVSEDDLKKMAYRNAESLLGLSSL
jgi:hypothetical protein